MNYAVSLIHKRIEDIKRCESRDSTWNSVFFATGFISALYQADMLNPEEFEMYDAQIKSAKKDADAIFDEKQRSEQQAVDFIRNK